MIVLALDYVSDDLTCQALTFH